MEFYRTNTKLSLRTKTNLYLEASFIIMTLSRKKDCKGFNIPM